MKNKKEKKDSTIVSAACGKGAIAHKFNCTLPQATLVLAVAAAAAFTLNKISSRNKYQLLNTCEMIIKRLEDYNKRLN